MRRDLEGLQITKGELRRLMGLSVDDLIRSYEMKDADRRSKFLSKETAVVASLTVIFGVAVLLIGDLIAWEVRGITIDLMLMNNPTWLVFSSIGLVSILAAIASRFLWLKHNTVQAKSLMGILEDVDKYNDLIKAIDLNDQLEDVGNPAVNITNREEIIAALKHTRHDLIRALKTERILRQNHRFIEQNPELFADKLTSLEAIQMSDRAREKGRLLNEALQLALSTQGEMRKLRKKRFY